MTSRKRRDWTAEEKLSILEEARQRLQTISGVCRQQGIATGQFYAWEKEARRGPWRHCAPGSGGASRATKKRN